MTKEQWLAIKEHDRAYDGAFYYGTKKSKTICKPSCTAHAFTPRDVVIFKTLDEGIEAGYHPCSRCRPDQPGWRGAGAELTARACNYMQEHYSEKFSLDQIATALYVNKIYLSKCFKKHTGTTLLKYYNHLRCSEAAGLLTDTSLAVGIIANKVGFVSSSHFTRIFKSFYDCTPSEYRSAYLDQLDK